MLLKRVQNLHPFTSTRSEKGTNINWVQTRTLRYYNEKKKHIEKLDRHRSTEFLQTRQYGIKKAHLPKYDFSRKRIDLQTKNRLK